jgi:hypothetical protein
MDVHSPALDWQILLFLSYIRSQFQTSFPAIRYFKPQEVGSSGKNLGLCSSPMRSKVRIPLSTNNFLGPAHWQKPEYYPIRVEGAFYMSPRFI